MPAHDRHHFVPQFYLRNFAHDAVEMKKAGQDPRQIGLFHIPRNLFVRSTSIKSQAQRHRLYGQGDLEAAFGDLEGATSAIFRAAIQTGTLPQRDSEDHHTMLVYVVYQLNRTPLAAERVRLLYQETARAMAKLDPTISPFADRIVLKMSDPVQEALRVASTAYILGSDLWYKLLVTDHAGTFITSDNPVVEYNQWFETFFPRESGLGIASPGLQLFLPISPRHCLVLYDNAVYTFGGRTLNSARIRATPEEVNSLNLLQAANAHEHIYFNDDYSEREIRRLFAAASVYRQPIADRVEEVGPFTGADGNLTNLRLFSKRRLATGFGLRSFRLTTRSRLTRRNGPHPNVRRPDWVSLIDRFNSLVEAGKLEPTQLSEYLRNPSQFGK